MEIKKQLLKVNYTLGRNGKNPDAICVHITDGTSDAALSWFNYSNSQVSAHYLITEEAQIIQLVEETNQSWGAGLVVKPTAKLVLERKGVNPNEYLINLECAGVSDINSAQYDALVWLVKDVSKRWNIPIDQDHIIPHRAIRADKNCPANISIPRIIVEATKPSNLTLEQKQSILQVIWAFTLDNFLVNKIRALLGGSPTFGGVPRSKDWPAVRQQHLKTHPLCEVCGRNDNLTVHHIIPYHINPSRELDFTNFITLCERPKVLNCHLIFGHYGNFTLRFNLNVKEDAKVWNTNLVNTEDVGLIESDRLERSQK